MAADVVLDVLLAPLRDGLLAMPLHGRVLFLQGRYTPALDEHAGRLVVEQTFKPYVDVLQQHGWNQTASADERFDLVLVLPSRQRDHTRALLVEAAARSSSAGTILVAAANDEGARSLQADAQALLGPLHVASMSKCRVMWSLAADRVLDASLAMRWQAAAAPVEVPGSGLLSRAGVFSWDRIDTGSALLAAQLPSGLSGTGADLGAGWGYLSAQVLQHHAGVVAWDLYEADARALELARINLDAQRTRAASQAVVGYHWHDVTTGVPRRYDFIVCNPPFHIGRAEAPGLGRRFIEVAAGALNAGGRLWLVANRHLAYEAQLQADFASVRRVADTQGYKVFEAIARGKPQ